MTLYKPKATAEPGESIQLRVPHYIQNNNTGGQGYRECNGTVHAMYTQYLVGLPHLYREPEDTYFKTLARYGDTTDHNAQTRTLQDFGIESYWSNTLTIDAVAHMVRRGFPVPIGTHYKSSGHIVLIVGVGKEGYLIQCPYGIRAGSSNQWHEIFYQNSQAKVDLMTWSLAKRIFDRGTLSHPDGWGRVPTMIEGQRTEFHPSVLGRLL